MGMGSLDCAERRAGALSTRRRSRRAPRPTLVSAAEIEPPDLRIIAQHLARPLGADAAHGEHIGPVTQRERFARVLLDEEDPEAARVDLANAVEDQALERRRQPGRWLVEEEQPGLH